MSEAVRHIDSGTATSFAPEQAHLINLLKLHLCRCSVLVHVYARSRIGTYMRAIDRLPGEGTVKSRSAGLSSVAALGPGAQDQKRWHD